MPCDTNLNEGQTLQQRMTQVQQALARLEASLTSGNVKVNIGANGAVAFGGARADEKPVGNLPARPPFRDHLQHFPFARGQ